MPRIPAKSGLTFRGKALFALSLFLWLLCLSLSLPQTALAQSSQSVPAILVRQLTPPGSSNELLRPGRIFIDRKFNEVFVIDPGNNRIVVFNTSGIYKFDFSGRDIFGNPTDVVVDSDGLIYVLCTTASGPAIHVFDYDGLYLQQLVLTGQPDGQIFNPSCLVTDGADNLYILDPDRALITCFDTKGVFRHQFPVLTDLDDKTREETTLGTPLIANGLVYLPVSSLGSVYVYDLQGSLQHVIGHQGNNLGEINFPVSVAVSSHGVVAVLDKHRFMVVCYDADGKFLGEFGGMGSAPGWFYHPSCLAMDQQDRCYISQIYLNRLQVCALPKFISETTKSISSINTQTPIDLLHTVVCSWGGGGFPFLPTFVTFKPNQHLSSFSEVKNA